MRLKPQLPPNDVTSYVNKMFAGTAMKSQMDGLFFAYVIYTIALSNKRWHKLTTTNGMIFTRLMIGFWVP